MYNNPSGLYSSENIKSFNSAVDDVQTSAASNEANRKYDNSVPVAQWLEHCVSSAKVVGAISREYT